MTPTVSVVIPTRGRPGVVTRAVRSALCQSLESIEAIVVVDGADPDTVRALSEIDDPRLRVLETPERAGGSAARNHGAAAARAQWVAFLDDDDEWLPSKLELQLAAATASPTAAPIVASRFEFRLPGGSHPVPRRLPRRGEALASYLLDRRSLFRDSTTVTTSMLFAPRSLVAAVPFDSQLPRHQDTDWLIRSTAVAGAQLIFLGQVLGVIHGEEPLDRVSTTPDWRRSLQWIRESRALVTPRAYAGFVLSDVSAAAARQGARGAFLELLREAFDGGRPRATHLAVHCAMWALPSGWRGSLRRRWMGLRG